MATWEQSKEEVCVKVPVQGDVSADDVSLNIRQKMLRLRVQDKLMLEGSLDDAGDIVRDGCYFNVVGDEGDRAVHVFLEKKKKEYFNWEKLLLDDDVDITPTRYAWMRVAIDGEDEGRLLFKLFGKVTPKTCENFRQLCTGEAVDPETGEKLSYVGSSFHKVMPNALAVGGDISSAADGSGGRTIYGPAFPVENFWVKHKEIGDIAMRVMDDGQVTSQFHVNFKFDNTGLDYTGVVFGRLELGFETMRKIIVLGTVEGQPTKEVTIIDGGDVHVDDVRMFKDDMFEEDKRRKGSTFDPASLDGNIQALLAVPAKSQATLKNAQELHDEMQKRGLIKDGKIAVGKKAEQQLAEGDKALPEGGKDKGESKQDDSDFIMH